MPCHSSQRGAVCPDMYLRGDSPAESGSPSSVVGWRSANKQPRVCSFIMHDLHMNNRGCWMQPDTGQRARNGESQISTIKKMKLISAVCLES